MISPTETQGPPDWAARVAKSVRSRMAMVASRTSAHTVAQAAPDLHRARLRLMASGAFDRRQLTLEYAHDALQGDLSGIVIQPVATGRAPLRADDPGVAQLHEDLLHEWLGDAHSPREVLRIQTLPFGDGQGENGSRRIVGLARDPHC